LRNLKLPRFPSPKINSNLSLILTQVWKEKVLDVYMVNLVRNNRSVGNEEFQDA
jgi:hypothetical protein